MAYSGPYASRVMADSAPVAVLTSSLSQITPVMLSRGRLQAGAFELGGDVLHAFAEAATGFTDQRQFFLDPSAHDARREEHAANIGLAGQQALVAGGFGKHLFMTEAVLQRHDDRLRAERWLVAVDGRLGVKGLDEHDHQIGRRQTARIGGRGDSDDTLAAVGVAQREAVRIDRIDMLRRARDQRHVGATRGQRAADRAAQRPGAKDVNLHGRRP